MRIAVWSLAVCVLAGCTTSTSEYAEDEVSVDGELSAEASVARPVVFPRQVSQDLTGREVELPRDFPGEVTLVLIAYEQYHQVDVNSWLPLVEELKGRHRQVDYVELPVVKRGNMFFRLWLDNVMRQGIPDTEVRRRTITLYIDKGPFLEALDLPRDQAEIAALLLDDRGVVHHREMGAMDRGKASAMRASVEELVAKVTAVAR